MIYWYFRNARIPEEPNSSEISREAASGSFGIEVRMISLAADSESVPLSRSRTRFRFDAICKGFCLPLFLFQRLEDKKKVENGFSRQTTSPKGKTYRVITLFLKADELNFLELNGSFCTVSFLCPKTQRNSQSERGFNRKAIKPSNKAIANQGQ
jgi:hypothetical protein